MAAPSLLLIVPARGGSKGLPRKNVRLLGGKPLLAWTADAIRAAALPGALAVLSTDDEEIAAAGRAAGLEVPFVRPPQHATDEARAEAVALHTLDWFAGAFGGQPEIVMWLQPTSPFRPASALSSAIGLLRHQADLDAVVGVKAIHRSLSTLFRLGADGRLARVSEASPVQSRRQAVEPLYTPNGAMYAIRPAALRLDTGFFPASIAALPMDAIASVDIDDATDWDIAEALAGVRGGRVV